MRARVHTCHERANNWAQATREKKRTRMKENRKERGMERREKGKTGKSKRSHLLGLGYWREQKTGRKEEKEWSKERKGKGTRNCLLVK